ncbi:TrfB-related DNA-binding protein [Nissabacter sp. SGAir0207]|uniref:TrfB-related DNA-binding protein n=1 Tax=Nissabacter sp. SGAir0207 TaxID=2126321 RepID=UPI0010CCCAD9|nr:TrfB-related DNA-binding protein [Nissabacter sp. SGAir0207]QCR38905.1 hypothetical protein C1N62_22610 [Nissabacter sp. SGAir0207]
MTNQEKTITQEEWDKLSPALYKLSRQTADIVRAVLVEGRQGIDVAKEHNVSRQAVYAAVARVRKIMEAKDLSVLEPVLVWLPPDKAKEVRAMAKQYEKK